MDKWVYSDTSRMEEGFVKIAKTQLCYSAISFLLLCLLLLHLLKANVLGAGQPEEPLEKKEKKSDFCLCMDQLP